MASAFLPLPAGRNELELGKALICSALKWEQEKQPPRCGDEMTFTEQAFI